ncbi:MAG TPA: PadR family transcriptional regulator [Terriglobales bacterium]|nr:PadR family transcriptional regulator [Terriglobales bacterium]
MNSCTAFRNRYLQCRQSLATAPTGTRLAYLSLRHVEDIGMPASPKSDLPQGTLDLLILKVVTLGPLHGYAITQRLQQVSREVVQVQQGSLYPALHRLENRGFLAAEWRDTETGREAKFYRLTRKGRAQLQSETASWERLAEAVALVLRLSEEGAK